MNEIITSDLDAKQLADRLTALELHSTSELARLERERNESQEKYATEATEHMLAVNKLANERDEALSQIAQAECRAERFCQERDEAREVASGLAVQEERVEEAQKELSSIHRWIERNHSDGFIDSLSYSQNLERVTDSWYDRLERVERERDEARDAIVGWENKWKCAVDMAARAELERDELKYSLKIRAINESLRYSEDRNESDNIISKLNFKL
jgi:hypothetical protein